VVAKVHEIRCNDNKLKGCREAEGDLIGEVEGEQQDIL
jgi:hypothetical protein